MSGLTGLSERERSIVYRCLRAVVDSTLFFADDREFDTIFGVSREEFQQIVQKWPNVDDQQPNVACAIGNAMNNLLGYPHGRHAEWGRHFDFTLEELQAVLANWSGRPQ